jgi:hypothetical protein
MSEKTTQRAAGRDAEAGPNDAAGPTRRRTRRRRRRRERIVAKAIEENDDEALGRQLVEDWDKSKPLVTSITSSRR